MSENKNELMEWIDKADHDLGSAKIIFLHIPEYFDTIAFHCQQAVEKYIKSVLLYYDIEFLRSHNLIYLLDLLSRKMEIAGDIYDKAILLNGFSIQIRYPDKTLFLTKAELEESIAIAEEFREFAINIIGLANS